MNNIDDILERLQSAKQPALEHPEELTDRIMERLNSLDSEVATPSPAERLKGNALLILRTALSLAAMWIIGFFIYLQFNTFTPVAQESLPTTKGAGSGASTLREVYKHRLCQDCKKTIRYTQIRSKLYENK